MQHYALIIEMQLFFAFLFIWQRTSIQCNLPLPLSFQEKNFLQMVTDAGSPSVQKQIIQPESLKSMEACYEQTLVELGNAIKVSSSKKCFYFFNLYQSVYIYC